MPTGIAMKYQDWSNDLAVDENRFYELLKEQKENHKENRTSKFNIKYHAKFPFKFSCGHTETCTRAKFLLNGLCKDCNRIKQKNQGLANIKKEERTEDYLTEIIESKIIEIVFCPEGCAVDMRFKQVDIEEDLWFPVQLKSSEQTRPEFNLKGKYDTQYEWQLLLCHDLLKNNIFMFKPFSLNMPKEQLGIPYKTGKGKYLKYKIDNHSDLTKTLLEDYYQNPDYKSLLKSGDTFDDMLPKKKQLEREYEKIRLNTIKFMKFSRYRNRPHDFIVNGGIKVQEKTVNKTKTKGSGDSYQFPLTKSNGSGNKRPYDVGDNAFYWLNLAGTRIFCVIPEEHLIDQRGKIQTSKTLNTNAMPPDWTYSYDTINQPPEKARLLKMFGVEDNELEMQLSLQMDNLEIGVEESKDEISV